jgi:release factor glutamine methyltransferase
MTTGATTLAEAVAAARSRFTQAGLPDAAIEARLLIGGLLALSSTDVFVNGDRVLGADDVNKIDDAVARRLKREPVHRILGSREFHGLDFLLSKETLEPRPDTEVLVESILEFVGNLAEDRPRILDLGTGTGAIVLSLLNALPDATGVGSDISEDALRTAKANSKRLGLDDRFETIQSHWFDMIEGRFDIIASNPPYIRSDVIPTLEPEVRNFDPAAALDGGPDGLTAYAAIAGHAAEFLKPRGYVGLEIGFDQKDPVIAIFEAAGFALVQAMRDYGDNDRVLIFTRPVPDVA